MGQQLALVLVLVSASGCHSLWPDDDLVGDGHLIEVRPSVVSFTGVEVDNSFVVRIVIGPPELVIALDENIVAANIVETHIDERGVLVIRQCAGCRDFAPSRGANIWCAGPLIDTIRTTGEVTAVAETAAEAVALDSAGDSRLDVTAWGARTVSAAARDSATLELTTDAPAVIASASGETTLRATGDTRTLEVTATQSARMSVRSTEAAVVTASGEATVVVAGEPIERTLRVSEAAAVTFPAR